MDPELDPTIPDYNLTIRSDEITAKPRKLRGTWPSQMPEPSVVDRLAAQVDGDAAKRVAKMDAAISHRDEMVRELRALWAPESPESDWGP